MPGCMSSGENTNEDPMLNKAWGTDVNGVAPGTRLAPVQTQLRQNSPGKFPATPIQSLCPLETLDPLSCLSAESMRGAKASFPLCVPLHRVRHPQQLNPTGCGCFEPGSWAKPSLEPGEAPLVWGFIANCSEGQVCSSSQMLCQTGLCFDRVWLFGEEKNVQSEEIRSWVFSQRALCGTTQ